jgi:hypothetical protein
MEMSDVKTFDVRQLQTQRRRGWAQKFDLDCEGMARGNDCGSNGSE